MTKAANSTKRSEKSNKSRKSRINGKRHIKQSLTFSSTDSSEEEQNVFPLKVMLKLIYKQKWSFRHMFFFITYFLERLCMIFFYTAYAHSTKHKKRSAVAIYDDIEETA